MVEPVEGERQLRESRRVTHPREVHRGSVVPYSWGRRILVVVAWSLAAFLLGAVLTGSGDARGAAVDWVTESLTIVDHTAIRQGERLLLLPEEEFLEASLGTSAAAVPSSYGAPVVQLDIEKRFLNKLLHKRSIAARESLLMRDPDSFVPGNIRLGDENVRVRVRLKGDLLDHHRLDSWSFRVEVRGENTLSGQRVLSFQHPDTRNFLGEWVFHRAFRREGGIAPRYSFVEVLLNGQSRGIYAMEEHFDKILVESNRRKEGPIVKVDEGQMFLLGNGFFAYDRVSFEAFQPSKIQESDVLTREFRVATSLMEGFRRRTYTASEVFNVDLLAKYVALCDLMGTWHALRYHNLRFYYDGFMSVLEPISFDGSTVGDALEKVAMESMVERYDDGFHKRLWEDEAFVELYLYHLSVFSRREYLDEFWQEVGPEADELGQLLQQAFPGYSFPRDHLYDNQEVIRDFLRSRPTS